LSGPLWLHCFIVDVMVRAGMDGKITSPNRKPERDRVPQFLQTAFPT
jgi:hypothetical protein